MERYDTLSGGVKGWLVNEVCVCVCVCVNVMSESRMIVFMKYISLKC